MSDVTKTPLIAIDIDDVTSNTHDAVKAWAHQHTGVSLDPRHYHTKDPYWDYYNSIWKRHGLDKLNFSVFLDEMAFSQGMIEPSTDAQQVIRDLHERFGVVFITSRDPKLVESTRAWLDARIDPSIPVYFAHNPLVDRVAHSKGELCNELGVKVLIDDNIDHCEDVIDSGVEAILFGDYGWNHRAPEHLTRCLNWRAVEDYFRDRK